MAYADYRLCDVCGCKAFYDSKLDYEWSTKNNPIPEAEQIKYVLESIGPTEILKGVTP